MEENSPIYPGTVLLAPLGSTKFNLTMLSITDGGPEEEACARADEKARATDPLLDRIRLETVRSISE